MATFMIADDRPANLFLLQEIIQANGHQVVAVSDNGIDALQSYFQTLPDISILDNRMPGLCGLDVAHKILEKTGGAKIILCTADFEEVEDAAAQLGIAVLPKPFSFEKMIQTMNRLLEE